MYESAPVATFAYVKHRTWYWGIMKYTLLFLLYDNFIDHEK